MLSKFYGFSWGPNMVLGLGFETLNFAIGLGPKINES
jgi:hypothetical protein